MSDKEIKVKCIKDGKMIQSGEIFCHKGSVYDAILCEDDDFLDPSEKYWYFVKDELDEEPNHSMDKEFFDEHFVETSDHYERV